jgi:hypothetical protein
MKGLMAMEIVWRNPLPPSRNENRIIRIADEDSRAVYMVGIAGAVEEFELILGGAAEEGLRSLCLGPNIIQFKKRKNVQK